MISEEATKEKAPFTQGRFLGETRLRVASNRCMAGRTIHGALVRSGNIRAMPFLFFFILGIDFFLKMW